MPPRTHAARRAALVAAHGPPGLFGDRGLLLRMLGLRDQLHPRDTVAYCYRDQAAAEAWTSSTITHYGLSLAGIVILDGGVAAVYDLRPVLEAGGVPLTAPGLPDGWKPPYPASSARSA